MKCAVISRRAMNASLYTLIENLYSKSASLQIAPLTFASLLNKQDPRFITRVGVVQDSRHGPAFRSQRALSRNRDHMTGI